MKKGIYLILVLLLLFSFSSCKDSSNVEDTVPNVTTNGTIQLPTLHNNGETTEPYVNPENFTYKNVYLKMMNKKTEVDLTATLDEHLESAKTVETPVLDNSYFLVGNIIVIYKNSSEEVNYGELYRDVTGTLYILSFDNPNKALLEIPAEQDIFH